MILERDCNKHGYPVSTDTVIDHTDCRVDCDGDDMEEPPIPPCQALANPTTLDDYKKAWEHWRFHSWRSGCSHAY